MRGERLLHPFSGEKGCSNSRLQIGGIRKGIVVISWVMFLVGGLLSLAAVPPGVKTAAWEVRGRR